MTQIANREIGVPGLQPQVPAATSISGLLRTRIDAIDLNCFDFRKQVIPHQFAVDSAGNVHAAETFGGRTQKFRPKKGADPATLIGQPGKVPVS